MSSGLPRTDKQIDIAKRAQFGRLGQSGAFGKRKRCRRGKSCGASCIQGSKFCMVDLPWASKSVGNVRDAIVKTKKSNSSPQGGAVELPKELLKKRPFVAPKIPKRLESNKPIISELRKALPKFNISEANGDITITQNIGGYEVKISVTKNRSMGFSVDDSLGNVNVPRNARLKIADQVRVAVDQLVKSVENGTPFAVSAHTADGKGDNRVEALKRLGFGNVKIPGFPQFGVVDNGKITPSDYIREFVGLPPLQFTEKTQASDVKDWHIVLFGVPPG